MILTRADFPAATVNAEPPNLTSFARAAAADSPASLAVTVVWTEQDGPAPGQSTFVFRSARPFADSLADPAEAPPAITAEATDGSVSAPAPPPPVDTVKLRVAGVGSEWSAASIARTAKVWAPSASNGVV